MAIGYGLRAWLTWIFVCDNDMRMDTSATTAIQEHSKQDLPRIKSPQMLARLVLREGKSFQDSALQAGYTPGIARRGLKALIAESPSVAKAFDDESKACISLDKLKPLAIARLHAEITNPRSSMGMKAIELAGRFKETDWFVRNQDINIGVFGALGESGQVLDAQVLPDENDK